MKSKLQLSLDVLKKEVKRWGYDKFFNLSTNDEVSLIGKFNYEFALSLLNEKYNFTVDKINKWVKFSYIIDSIKVKITLSADIVNNYDDYRNFLRQTNNLYFVTADTQNNVIGIGTPAD